jgi:O-antigen/teichoic acid export membrane protein
LMGPFTVIYLGMTLVTVPEAVRSLQRSPRHLLRFSVLASAALAVVGLAWGLVLLVALPRGLGGWLLGPIWRPAYPLTLPQTITIIGLCFSAGATTGLHALGAARRSLRAAFIASALCLIGGLVGALTGGVLGAVWGVAIGTWVGVLVWWWYMRGALREYQAEPSQAVPAAETAVETHVETTAETNVETASEA